AMPGYGGVFQLWPSSQVWAEGEMDFPEGSYEGSLNLYHHRVGSNPEQNYLVKSGLGKWTDWHTATIEWLPGSVTYSLDGVVVAKVTDPAQVASTPHNWVFQTASHTGGDVPNHVQGHVYIDWVVAYSR
ncbi:MAG TPA: glycoside hydrolase family 16 protein, partial [Sphingomonas sp.]